MKECLTVLSAADVSCGMYTEYWPVGSAVWGSLWHAVQWHRKSIWLEWVKKIETRTESWIYTQLFKVFCHVGDRKWEGWGGRRRRERGGGKATRECRGQRFYLLPSLLPFLCKGQITECVQIEESLWRIKICGREDRGKNLQPPKAERRNENYFTWNKPGK